MIYVPQGAVTQGLAATSAHLRHDTSAVAAVVVGAAASAVLLEIMIQSTRQTRRSVLRLGRSLKTSAFPNFRVGTPSNTSAHHTAEGSEGLSDDSVAARVLQQSGGEARVVSKARGASK